MIVSRRIFKAPAMAQEGPRPLGDRETGGSEFVLAACPLGPHQQAAPRSERGNLHITFSLIRGPHNSFAGGFHLPVVGLHGTDQPGQCSYLV